MKLVTSKSRLEGKVKIPASKSHTIRAIAIASIANGKSIIRQPLVSQDTLSAVECYRALGADIDISNDKMWLVNGTSGKIEPLADKIDVGNSGTTLRIALGTAALAEQDKKITFTGDKQIQTRPLKPLVDALNTLGAKCKSQNPQAKAPVEISGTIKGGNVSISCPTSQFLTSLLLCCPLAQNDTQIHVTLLNEPGYVQMTLDWLDRQNINYQHKNLTSFKIKGSQKYKSFDYTIPADFSSATFFICAAALFAEKVTIQGLDFSDSQPDKLVVDYLELMGANIKKQDNNLIITASQLTGADIDMNQTPDALPAMAVTAAFAKGKTRLFNVAQARNKETDRIKCMAQELNKIGIAAEEIEDGLIIEPGKISAAQVDGRDDHRIVMAMAIAGLGSDKPLEISSAQAMNVTFPDYVKLMNSIGANMKITD
ncbi:MAG: 3-phosphoshikimate 1-carboxyvinyltransferase [Planctomycetes bacterium]|nr:3-phosphoshikimate 1-carboxyvinyltransferase [Planctomycetota bacterium]MBL7106223.1 3-phosphoshikimate 1-carboxyvinyltransferase [Phycisphaerae bacterium]